MCVLDIYLTNSAQTDVGGLVLDYDQYYASLAASTLPSAQATPSGLGASGSDDFGDFPDEEEEEMKPSVEYLDSLNDYRKRSRSREDEGGIALKKVAKMESMDRLRGLQGLQGPMTNGDLDGGGGTREVEAAPVDDPVVFGTSFVFLRLFRPSLRLVPQ